MAGGLSQNTSGTTFLYCNTTHSCIALSSACVIQTITRACGHCYDTVSQCCCDSDAFGAGRGMCSSEASCGVMACLSISPAWKVQLSRMLFSLVHCVAHLLHNSITAFILCEMSVCVGQQKLCQGMRPTTAHYLCLLALARAWWVAVCVFLQLSVTQLRNAHVGYRGG